MFTYMKTKIELVLTKIHLLDAISTVLAVQYFRDDVAQLLKQTDSPRGDFL